MDSKIVLITGGSSGKGLATAHYLAEKGVSAITLFARRKEALEAAEKEIKENILRSRSWSSLVTRRKLPTMNAPFKKPSRLLAAFTEPLSTLEPFVEANLLRRQAMKISTIS